MDRNSNRARRPSARSAQQLRDISHLYLSTSRQASPAEPRARVCFRLGIATDSDQLAKVDLVANLAVQFARLGRRTLVVDLDARLPNVGFRLGLDAAAYLRHTLPSPAPRVEPAVLGIGVLEGVAVREASIDNDAFAGPALPAAERRTWEQAEVLLVNLPAMPSSLRWLSALQGAMADENDASAHADGAQPVSRPASRPAARLQARTTMARAGQQSRMFGAWLQTAKRQSGEPAAVRRGELDALLFVARPGAQETETSPQVWRSSLDGVPVHLVHWAVDADPQATTRKPSVWATVPALPVRGRQRNPSSLLFPEHATSRLFESLAQSLLAGAARQGGHRVRTS